MKYITQHYTKLEKVHGGWSFDEKFKAHLNNGEAHFIRIVQDKNLKIEEHRFSVMSILYNQGCFIQKPISFEHIEDKIVQTFEWIEGETLKNQVILADEKTQYEWGVQAGKQLKIIHSIPSNSKINMIEYYQNRVKNKLTSYDACQFKLDHEEKFKSMIDDGWATISNITPTFQHGDFHIENMVLNNNQVHIIDFNRSDEGDPWQEFDRIAFSARVSPAFAKGQIHGYFDNQPPFEFYIRLRFYLAINSFSSIPWAYNNYGEDEVKHMKAIANEILVWYQDDSIIPSWMQ
jgi:aminoglycoside phosphotransferase (APT) family kinase protein